MNLKFVDKLLKCSDCRESFVFTAGEQLFFCDKQFKNDPKRCKPCKAKRAGSVANTSTGISSPTLRRTETRTRCSACDVETTVPFKPTQGRPVLCRECFQAKARLPFSPGSITAPSPYLVDPRAAALTQLSKDTLETGLSSDDAVRASSSIATANAHSSVATAADLASISGPPVGINPRSRPSAPGHTSNVEVLPIAIVEPDRQEASSAQELVAFERDIILA